MNNNIILKRIGAYLIDFIVITLISMILTKMSFINPKYDEYVEVTTKYNEILSDYYEKEIDIDELNEEVNEISYEMNKSGYVYLIGDIAVIILYFGVFNYVYKGQTLGKKLMNIQIISNKNKPLKMFNYFIRCIILNGIIMDIITLIAICFSKNTYYDIYRIGSNINMMFQIIIFLSIMFSVSGRGLHDIIAGTKVISTKDYEEITEDKTEENLEEKKENNKNRKKKEVKKDE